MSSVMQQLVEAKLHDQGGLEDFVTSRRRDGVAWRIIARDLYDATGVDVTYETLRTWFLDGDAA